MKTSILPEITSLALPEASRLKSILRILPQEATYSLLVLESILVKCRTPIGKIDAGWAADWVEAMDYGERHLERFLTEKLGIPLITRRQMDIARGEAESFLGKGIWAATWSDAPAGAPESPDFPRVFFGKGRLPSGSPWVGFFNSRKPRALVPHEEWLAALRVLLPHVVSSGGGIAGSVGTLTYDLATAYAQQTGSPLLLVVPFPLEHLESRRQSSLLSGPVHSEVVLSPVSRAVPCTKPCRLLRRDRMLARLADVHCVLTITSGGNLFPILEEEQSRRPRSRWVLVPARRCIENEGNFRLLEADPERTRSFSLRIEAELPPFLEAAPEAPPEIQWKDYLYHYTRACNGAWPGQSHEEYLQSLLRGDPDSGHTALDTLMRMVVEGKIRAGTGLVRGSEPVVSWTSKSPLELDSIRQWNPALIRWTFEPFGIAVARTALKKIGAKPAIYGGNALYPQLDPSDRFRFQLHQPPGRSWKQEREWRSRGDLSLAGFPAGDVAIFVPGPFEASIFKRDARCGFPVLDLSSILGSSIKSRGKGDSPIN